MKKWYAIIIMMMVLFVPSVLAGLEIQISEDNSTWLDLNSTVWAGGVDESLLYGYANYLERDTTYYVRVKNDSTAWGYYSFVTEGEVLLGFILGVIGFISSMLFVAYFASEEHFFLKLGSVLMSFVTFMIVPGALLNGYSSVAGLFTMLIWTYFVGVVVYILGYTGWKTFKRLGEQV